MKRSNISIILAVFAVVLAVFTTALVGFAQDTVSQPDLMATYSALQTQIADVEAQLSAFAPAGEVAEGWAIYEGVGVTLSLPDTYVDIDLASGDIEAMLGDLGEFEEDLLPLVQTAFQNPELYRFVALNSDYFGEAFTENVNVTASPLPFEVTTAELLPAIVAEFEGLGVYTVQEADVVEVNGIEGIRMLLSLESSALTATQLQYSFLLDGVYYAITFSASSEDAEARLPIFEEVVQSLVIHDAQ